MIDAVVIGAGQSGLAASWHLTCRGLEHVVLERGLVAESWRSQRWDSFALNTPVWMNRLAGEPDDLAPRDAFLTRDAWTDHLAGYADAQQLPIRTATAVTAVEATGRGGTFQVSTAGDGAGDPIEARHVIVATGAQIVPKVPAVSASLPAWLEQLHTADYRAPSALADGGVLVVGSAQSGVQVAEDLLDADRTVYLCTSPVGRFRRRQRGRDTLAWLTEAGFYDVTPEELPDPRMQFAPIPQISGVGDLGHTVSLQSLAERGVLLMGRPVGVDGHMLLLDDSLGANIALADRVSAEFTAQIEQAIRKAGRTPPPLEPDPADEPHPDPVSVHGPATLDLEGSGISTVVWATGFDGDFSFLRVPVLDERGGAIHDHGASPVPGLHFIGLRWMTKRNSALISGAGADAAALADRIATASARAADR